MQIDSIEVFHVALPLKVPRETKVGQLTTLETVLVRMTSAQTAGWGEASPGNAPLDGTEWAAGVFECVRDWLAPRLAGARVESGDDLQERLSPLRGNRFAKAALDTAWWDLKARLMEQPLHKVLGGKRDAVEVGVAFDEMETIDDLLAAMGRAFEAGYTRVDLKMRPGWDLNMLNAVRHEFPTQTVHADIEAALTLNDMEILYRLDDFGLAMVEQPLPADDLVGHAMVQEAIRTPVCLDEGITTPQQVDIALELKSAQYVNVKPGRVGGLTPAVAIHDMCHQGCVPCFVGAMCQSAIGTRLGLALAAKENFLYPADYAAADEIFCQDLALAPPPTRDENDEKLKIRLWDAPGIGTDPDPHELDKFTLTRAAIG
jgi:O-succinylbenzoate synthase